MALTPKQRKVQRDYLQRKKRNLLSKGGHPQEIKDYFNGQYNFKNLSDERLESLYKTIKAKPLPVVVGDKVYTRDYIKKAKAWYGDNFAIDRLPQGFRKSERSEIAKKSLSEIKQHKKDIFVNAKNRYLEGLNDVYSRSNLSSNKAYEKRFNKFYNAIKRMTQKDFSNFLSSPYSDKISFDKVYTFINTDSSEVEEDTDNGYQETIAEQILQDVEQFVGVFKEEKKRNRQTKLTKKKRKR